MTIFFNNLRRIFSKPISIVLMIILPVILNATLISMYITDEKATVGITIKEDTKLTAILCEVMAERYKTVEINEDDRNDAIINGEVDCVVVINEGFTESIIHGNESLFDFYMLQESNVSSPIRIFLNTINYALLEFGSACGDDEAVFYEMLNNYLDGKFNVNFNYFDDSFEKMEIAIRSLGYLVLGLMFFVGMSTTSVLKDKEENVYTKIVVSPIKRRSYLIQNILSYAVVAIIQIVALFCIMVYFLNVEFGDKLYMCMGVSLLFSILCISIGITISSICKKVSTANAIISMINVPMLMLGGCFWHIDIMPQALQNIGKCLPTYWYMEVCEQILNGVNFQEYVKYLIFMMVCAFALIGVSSIYSKFSREK